MKKLLIYNLETNLDSYVLAASHDWIESFSKYVDRVEVYSTHVGRYNFSSNVTVHELGGGNVRNRVIAVLRLLNSFARQVRSRRNLTVIYHMTIKPMLIVGPLFKLTGVKQGFWYSHSKNSITLLISYLLANKVFSSAPGTIPLSGRKVKYVGHGIKTSRFSIDTSNESQKREGIVALGRITPIKNIHLAIEGIYEARANSVGLTCMGSPDNQEYVEELIKFAKYREISLKIVNPVNYHLVPHKLREFDAIFSGTPKSIDKAAIEGALSGCFVISQEPETLRLTAMIEIYKTLGYEKIPTIKDQVSIIFNLNDNFKESLRLILKSKSAELNDLNNTTFKILSELKVIS